MLALDAHHSMRMASQPASIIEPMAGAERTPAFDEVYSTHFQFVWRVLRGMGVPPGLVDDAAQEVFVVVLRRLPEFDGRHSVKTWLFQIALRVASNQRRSLRRRGSREELDESMAAPGPGPDEATASRRALADVMEILDTLDEPLRVVLVLSQFEQMTAPEIGELLGLKVNTVSSRLRRAREAFAARLERKRRSTA